MSNFSPLTVPEEPQALTDEVVVIGSMLADPAIGPSLLSELEADDFTTALHMFLFQAMQGCIGRQIEPNFANIAAELDAMGELELVGGFPAIIELTGSIPYGMTTLRDCCERIRRAAIKRAQLGVGREIITMVYRAEVSRKNQQHAGRC